MDRWRRRGAADRAADRAAGGRAARRCPQAPGARDARVPCPFALDPGAVRSKFSKKRGVLTVFVREA